MDKNKALQQVMNLIGKSARAVQSAVSSVAPRITPPSIQSIGNKIAAAIPLTPQYTQRVQAGLQEMGAKYPSLSSIKTTPISFASTKFSVPESFGKISQSYGRGPIEGYKAQLSEVPRIYGRATQQVLKTPIERAKFFGMLGQRVVSGDLRQPFTPDQQRIATEVLSSLMSAGMAETPMVAGASLSTTATRTYAQYLRGLKKYNIPQSATTREVGDAFEQAILRAEGNHGAVQKVLKDFRILNRIKPEQAVTNVPEVVAWYRQLIDVPKYRLNVAKGVPPTPAEPKFLPSGSPTIPSGLTGGGVQGLTLLRDQLARRAVVAERTGNMVLTRLLREQIAAVNSTLSQNLQAQTPVIEPGPVSPPVRQQEVVQTPIIPPTPLPTVIPSLTPQASAPVAQLPQQTEESFVAPTQPPLSLPTVEASPQVPAALQQIATPLAPAQAAIQPPTSSLPPVTAANQQVVTPSLESFIPQTPTVAPGTAALPGEVTETPRQNLVTAPQPKGPAIKPEVIARVTKRLDPHDPVQREITLYEGAIESAVGERWPFLRNDMARRAGSSDAYLNELRDFAATNQILGLRSGFLGPDGAFDTAGQHAEAAYRQLQGSKNVQDKEEALIELMARGNQLRAVYTPTEANFEIIGEPTAAQLNAIMQQADEGKTVHLDITSDKGKVLESKTFTNSADLLDYLQKKFSSPASELVRPLDQNFNDLISTTKAAANILKTAGVPTESLDNMAKSLEKAKGELLDEAQKAITPEGMGAPPQKPPKEPPKTAASEPPEKKSPAERKPSGEKKESKYAKVNLNMDRIATGEDIKKNIRDWSEKNAKQLEEEYAKFGKKDFKNNLRRMALDVGAELEELTGGLLNEKLGRNKRYNLSTPEGQQELFKDVYILRNANIDNYTKASTFNKQITEEIDPQRRKVLESQYLELQAQMMAVRLALQDKTQLAGQFLQFFNELAKAGNLNDVGARLAQVERVLKKQFGLGADQMDQIMKAAIKVNMDNPEAVGNFLKDVAMTAHQGTSWNPLKNSLLWELFYNNLLSSPRTHDANFFGNLLSYAMNEFAVRPVGTGIEKLRAGIAKRPSEASFRELLPAYMSVRVGIPKGLMRAFHMMKTGFDPDEIINPNKWSGVRLEAWSVHPNPRVRKWAPVVNFVGRTMRGEDAVVKSMLYHSELEAQIMRKILKEGLTKTDEIAARHADISKNLAEFPELIEKAKGYARYGTFNEAPDRIAQLLIKLREILPISRPIIPFISIASNLARQGFRDWSPVGFMKRGGMEEAARSYMYARALIGSALLALGGYLYLNKQLRLDAPTAQAERARFYGLKGQTRNQAYSLILTNKDGNEVDIPARRLEPFAHPFFMGAIFSKNFGESYSQGAGLPTALLRATRETGRYVLSSSYLNNISNVFEALSGNYSAEEKTLRLGASSLFGFIPGSSFWRDIAFSNDPYFKDSKTFGEFFKEGLPILSQTVPNRLTPFGVPAQRPGNPFFFIKPTEKQQDTLLDELDRMKFNVSFVGDSIAGVKLSANQQREYQKTAGRIAEEMLSEIIQSSAYQTADDFQKEKYLQDAVDAAKEEARSIIMDQVMSSDPQERAQEIYKNLLTMPEKSSRKYIQDLIEEGVMTGDTQGQVQELIQSQAPAQRKQSLLDQLRSVIETQAAEQTPGQSKLMNRLLASGYKLENGAVVEGSSLASPVSAAGSSGRPLTFQEKTAIKKERTDTGYSPIDVPIQYPVYDVDSFRYQFETLSSAITKMENRIKALQKADVSPDIKKQYLKLYVDKLNQTRRMRANTGLQKENKNFFEQYIDSPEGKKWFKAEVKKMGGKATTGKGGGRKKKLPKIKFPKPPKMSVRSSRYRISIPKRQPIRVPKFSVRGGTSRAGGIPKLKLKPVSVPKSYL